MLRRKRKTGMTDKKKVPAKRKKIRIKRKTVSPEASERPDNVVPMRLREDRTKIDFKKRAKRNKRRRRMLSMAFLMVVLLCIMFFAPFFGISKIEVKGLSRMTQEQIIQASGIEMGENLFACNTRKAERKLQVLPYTHKVKVRRGIPSTIKITVEESVPFAYIRNGESQFILIDKEGKMLETVEILPEQHFIQLITQNIENPVMGETFSEENQSFFKKYLATVSEIVHNNIVDKISLIDVSNELELNIRYNQLEVKLGDAEKLSYKFTNLKAILEKIGEKAKGSLDLSIPGKSPYREIIE